MNSYGVILFTFTDFLNHESAGFVLFPGLNNRV